MTGEQALGQWVDVLQHGGWVESRRDPDDARVRLVHRTARGAGPSGRIDVLVARAEQRMRADLDTGRSDRMEAALRELGAGRL